ncbi:Tetratricopeptide repeat (TPR)-like superfamily protein [Abeliophyllum distichum]|uniref:Tetratricopeptide repeat (TPR)-like superfamily protein n=1 Tax=Abeliophyllum distichum TaxID=126358 RepID=A0ABD1VCA1_9LAMI
MDSASATLPIASTDVSPPEATVEDDGSLPVTAGLAKEAAVLFQAGKLVDCLGVLNQLLQKREDDPKVLHNIAIAESVQDGCSDPKRLIEVLENVKKLSEKLARTSEGNLEAFSNNGSKMTAVTEGINVAHQFSSSPVVCSDEFDTSVTIFNMAVIWFHLHEYAKPFSILDTLYQNIEPIDEGTALRICLLLLDVALLSHHASKSADVINYMEKVFCVNSLISPVNNGNSLPVQHVSRSALLPSYSTIPDASTSDSVTNANTLEISFSRALSEEVLEDESLQLSSSLDISEQNLQRPGGLAFCNDVPRSHAEESHSTIDLRIKLHFYKVRYFLLTRNLKEAKREVKMAMNIAHGKDYPMALYLKSHLEYARGNHRKAIKLLMASSNRIEIGISSMYYNNLGCIFYRLGKHHTSGVFFSKALSISSLVRKEKPLKLATISQDKSLLITYNCGLHYLVCGKPFPAARCFQKASLGSYNRPLVWLRIAECCLMALEKGILNAGACAPDRSDIKVNVVGKGKWRRLAIEDGISTNGQWEYVEKEELFSGDDKQPNLSISLARQCLVNALYLLDCSGLPYSSEDSELRETVSCKSITHKNVAGGDSKTTNAPSGSGQVNVNGEWKEQKGGNSYSTCLQNSTSDYDDICRKENQMMKQAVFADLAYVELELGNPLKALAAARSLLKLPGCSRAYIFLGNMYVAEALCLLNQPKEAAEHLMMYVSGGNSVELPYTQGDCEKGIMEEVAGFEESNGGSNESEGSVFLKPEEAVGVIYANTAANYTMLGDLEKAHQFAIKALSAAPNNAKAILTAIYVDLKFGKTQEALAKLRHYTCVRFLPGGSTLNGSS